MALTAKDFEVGDYIQLPKENRRGYVRFIGRIQSIGKVCIGVECDKEIPNGNDGTFNGTKYFECAPGKGTFVVPARIRVIVRKAKAVERSQSRGRPSGSPGPVNRSQSSKPITTSTTTTNTTNTTTTTKSNDPIQRSASVPRDAISSNDKTNTSTPHLNANGLFDIPKDITTKEMITFILSCLNNITTPSKARIDVIEKYRILISEDEKMSSEDVKYAITEFKKSMQTQLRDRHVPTHEKVLSVVVAMAKSYPDLFSTCAVFYIKQIMANFKSKDLKSLSVYEKAMEEILKVTAQPKKIVAGFAATAKDKSPAIRKYSFVFLKSILEKQKGAKVENNTIPNGNDTATTTTTSQKEEKQDPNTVDTSNKNNVSDGSCTDNNRLASTMGKETLDLITETLKQGFKDQDKIVRTEVMECVNILKEIDDTQFQAVLANVPAQFKKIYQQRYGSASTIPDEKNDDTGAKIERKTPAVSKDPRSSSTRPGRTVTKNENVRNGTKSVGGRPVTNNTAPRNETAKRNSDTKVNLKNKTERRSGGSDIVARTTKDKTNPRGKAKSEIVKPNVSGKQPNKKNTTKEDTDSTKQSNGHNHTNGTANKRFSDPVKSTTEIINAEQVMAKSDVLEHIQPSTEPDKTQSKSEPESDTVETRDSDSDVEDEAKRDQKGTEEISETDSNKKKEVETEDVDKGTVESGSTPKPKEPEENEPDRTIERPVSSGSDENEDEDEDDEEDGTDAERAQLLESFLELKEPQINWKMIEYLSKNNVTQMLLGYISRMPSPVKTWQANLSSTLDFNALIPPTKPLSSEDEPEVKATKLSFSLMRILSNEKGAETMKAFLLRKCHEIIMHCLAVFHPSSEGNAYHGRVVLEVLLVNWPRSLISKLVDEQNLHLLTKNALFRNLHQGNLNSFFIDLICYRPVGTDTQMQIAKKKERLLAIFREWQFMEYLMDISSSSKHGDDIATKYATFFIDLVARSASIEEAGLLFEGHEHVIVDSMVKALLDADNTRTLWHRVTCGQILVQYLDICSRPTIINPAQAYTDPMGLTAPEASPNVLHQMFDKSLKRLHTYIPDLCKAVMYPSKPLTEVPLADGFIHTPFGQVRLNCLELITVSADFAQFKCGKVLSNLKLDFWKAILDMAFIHKNNNLFLCHFRRLIHLCMIFRRRFLKYLFVECNMLDRLVDFYNTNTTRWTLHGYVLQMLWDIFYHDQREEENNNENPEQTNETNKENNTNETEKDKDDDKDDSFGDTGEFVLKPNFSKEPEDQWNIVKFLESQPKWTDFSQTLTHEMEIQMTMEGSIPMGMPAGGEDAYGQNDTTLEENPEEEDNDDDGDDDSSDSDNEEEEE